MADPTPDAGEDTGTPLWVKVSGIIGGVLVTLIVVMLLTGHGPGRHMPGGQMPPSSATESAAGDPASSNGGP